MSDTASAQKRRIMREAAKLFAKNGYDATGIAEIASVVSLGKGALYHHIGSKEQLLYDISRDHVEDMIAYGTEVLSRDATATHKVRALAQGLMKTIAANLPELTVFFADYRALTGERRDSVIAARREYEAIWLAAIQEGQARGEFRTADPLIVKGVLGLYNYSYLWLKPRGKRKPEEIADLFADFMLRGLHSDGYEEPS